MGTALPTLKMHVSALIKVRPRGTHLPGSTTPTDRHTGGEKGHFKHQVVLPARYWYSVHRHLMSNLRGVLGLQLDLIVNELHAKPPRDSVNL